MNASITDEKLIAAIGNDDYTSYNKLFVRYYSRLCCYVYRLLGEKEDAEDVVQDLFFTLWKNRKKIAIGENVSGYLYKMARNLALNHIRTQTNYDCINLLPGRCKEVLLLHRVKGLKQKEIADQLSISVKTIKNQIWASLQRLKKCLEVKGI